MEHITLYTLPNKVNGNLEHFAETRQYDASAAGAISVVVTKTLSEKRPARFYNPADLTGISQPNVRR